MAVTYNTITIPFPMTERLVFSSEKDPSGTDQLYTGIEYACKGVIAPNLIAYPGQNPGNSPGATIKYIRHMLTSPRKDLLITDANGSILANVTPGNALISVDDANGPFPDNEAFSCQQVLQGSYLVNFKIKTRLRDCAAQTGSTSSDAILSHRWTDSVAIDGVTWCCTKTRSGRAVISSLSNFTADSYRADVTPPILAGYLRETAEYHLDETTLILTYRFVDKQKINMPVPPATKMRIKVRESTPMKGGVTKAGCSIYLAGPIGSDKAEMLAAAITVGMKYVFASGVKSANGKYLLGSAVEAIYDDDENAVNLQMEWNKFPETDRITATPGPFERAANWLRRQAEEIGETIGRELFPVPGLPPIGVPPNNQGQQPAALSGQFADWINTPVSGSDNTVGVGPPVWGSDEDCTLEEPSFADPCTGQSSLIGDGPAYYDSDLVSVGSDGDDTSGDTVLVGTDPGSTGTATLQTFPTADDNFAFYQIPTDNGVVDYSVYTAGFHDDPGTDVLASSNGGIGGQIQIFGGQTIVDIGWSITRIGAPPQIPPVKSADPNWVSVGAKMEPQGIELAADGVTPIYTMAGIYSYKALDRSKVAVGAPIPPYIAPGPMTSAANQIAKYAVPGIVLPFNSPGFNNPNPFLGLNQTNGQPVAPGDNG